MDLGPKSFHISPVGAVKLGFSQSTQKDHFNAVQKRLDFESL
jgi:hypothetical protein